MLKNRFAIVKEWKHTVSAEDECIQRIKIAAKNLGIICDVVDQGYYLLDSPTDRATEETHDFVLHIHFCSAKANNLFSFVTLWNPVEFFHAFGYRQYSDNLISHDDFLSCGSVGADTHLNRLLLNSSFHLKPVFNMFHSLDGPVLEPEIRSNRRLHYCGINWERLGKKAGRFDDVLKHLDGLGVIDIYGPKQLQGIQPWAGYKCYRGEVPFDGISMVKTIHESGISLVFSSEAHIEAGMISNRLFEAMAAGACIIADHNPIVAKILGSDGFYVKEGAGDRCEQVLNLIEWINSHPEQAYEKAYNAQQKFLKEYRLSHSIKAIYSGLQQRKEQLRALCVADAHILVIYFVGVTITEAEKNLPHVVSSIKANLDDRVKHIVVLPQMTGHERLKQSFKDCLGDIKYCEFVVGNLIHFSRAYFGRAVQEILKAKEFDYFSIVLPGEVAFENHFTSVVKCIENEGVLIGTSDILLKGIGGDGSYYAAHQTLRLLDPSLLPSASFVYSKRLLDKIGIEVFSQLDWSFGVMASLEENIAESRRSSVVLEHRDYIRSTKDIAVISDYRPVDPHGLLRPSNAPVSAGISVVANELSLLRRFYLRNRKAIDKFRAYPKVWSFLRYLAAPFLR